MNILSCISRTFAAHRVDDLRHRGFLMTVFGICSRDVLAGPGATITVNLKALRRELPRYSEAKLIELIGDIDRTYPDLFSRCDEVMAGEFAINLNWAIWHTTPVSTIQEEFADEEALS